MLLVNSGHRQSSLLYRLQRRAASNYMRRCRSESTIQPDLRLTSNGKMNHQTQHHEGVISCISQAFFLNLWTDMSHGLQPWALGLFLVMLGPDQGRLCDLDAAKAGQNSSLEPQVLGISQPWMGLPWVTPAYWNRCLWLELPWFIISSLLGWQQQGLREAVENVRPNYTWPAGRRCRLDKHHGIKPRCLEAHGSTWKHMLRMMLLMMLIIIVMTTDSTMTMPARMMPPMTRMATITTTINMNSGWERLSLVIYPLSNMWWVGPRI